MTSFPQLATDILSLLVAQLAGTFTGVVTGPDKPQVSDQDKVWFKTDTSGNPVGAFQFSNGQWISTNPVAPNDPCPRPWLTTSASAPTDVFSYDGGDGTDPVTTLPTETSGAMWTLVGRTAAAPYGTMQVVVPIGVGTFVNLDGTIKQVAEGQGNTLNASAQAQASADTNGQELYGGAGHALRANETWHQHGIGQISLNPGGPYSYMALENGGDVTSGRGVLTPNTPGTIVKQAVAGVLATTISDITHPPADGSNPTSGPYWTFETDVPAAATIVNNGPPAPVNTTASVSHNNLPPFVAVYWIQRTSRKYYVGG
jgi:hypothetical protein